MSSVSALAHAPLWAQGESRSLAVAQIADLSPLQQDVGRDFLAGSRAAWQDLNERGGIKGRQVQHLTLETDGTQAGLQDALRSAQAHAGCVVLSGCVGDSLAAGIAALQAAGPASSPLAHAAPWLHRQLADRDDTVFCIFADYQAQIAHAVKSLATMGVQRAAVVFADAQIRQQLQPSITQAASSMGLQLRVQPLPGSAATQATPSAPADAIVLFVGGTPELHAYVSRLKLPAGGQCYVVALADVNLQVLAQMGGLPRNVSVIATQPVPVVTAGLPIVRAYRDILGRLYDEPPSPLGLAGFIAARYTAEVMAGINGPITRASMLAALRQRATVQLGGFTVSYQDKKLANTPVTQTLLTADGRIVG